MVIAYTLYEFTNKWIIMSKTLATLLIKNNCQYINRVPTDLKLVIKQII